jgi:hypothetical protein
MTGHARLMVKIFTAGVLLACTGTAAATPDVERRKSVEGINAIEEHWSQAFVTGDADYLGRLLADDYVSINAKGVARPKAEVIAMAKRYAGSNPALLQRQVSSPVSIRGDTAIVHHRSSSDISVDIFYWHDGNWRAWYSQHLTPPAE